MSRNHIVTLVRFVLTVAYRGTELSQVDNISCHVVPGHINYLDSNFADGEKGSRRNRHHTPN